MIYWLWLSLKAKTPFFFFSVNPGIESGGLLIESKYSIFQLIPQELIPGTLFFRHPCSFEEVYESMYDRQVHFPVIAKPDHGERGYMVEKLEDSEELKKYISRIRDDFILQEYIDLPVELGVFYYRMPDENHGVISSMVRKELLYVAGDGRSDMRTLILNDPRARRQMKILERRHPDLMNYIPGRKERIELVPIGNHSRGATFINVTELADKKLAGFIDGIAARIEGFYYGRFDIRCRSIDALKNGEEFKILELNGAKSEPAHIYHPGFPLFKAYRVLFFHWRILYRIAVLNHKRGYRYPSWESGWATWKKYRSNKRNRK